VTPISTLSDALQQRYGVASVPPRPKEGESFRLSTGEPHSAVDPPEWLALAHVLVPHIIVQRMRVVAISGSQGSGKTTLAQIIEKQLAQNGVQALVVSLDDFYLTRAQRLRLSESVHPLLRTRGVPGTHDTGWLAQVLAQMQTIEADNKPSTTPLTVPRFDKSIDDRVRTHSQLADVLIVEGWCLGLRAQPSSDLRAPCNALEAEEDPQGHWRQWVNDALRQAYEPLWPSIDFWLHLRVPGFEQVLDWRPQQEQAIPAQQRMSGTELKRFVAHYERCTRALWSQPPLAPGCMLSLDGAHQVDEAVLL